MISPEISARLKALRFPLIVGVVFIHAHGTQVTLKGNQSVGAEHISFATYFLTNLISDGIARLAVPIFFLISSYLFFQGYDGSMAAYATKLRRRLRTLLVPYLIWNAATLALFAIGEALPATRVYFANKNWPAVRDFTALDYVNAMLGLTTKYPISYQIWFLRDLMVMMIAAPLMYFILRRVWLAVPLFLFTFIAWYTAFWTPLWPNDASFLFFLGGSFLAIHRFDLLRLDKWHIPFGIAFAVLLIADAVTEGDMHLFMMKAMIVAGIPFAWWLTGQATRRDLLRDWLFGLSASSFFVYAAHEPLLTTLRKIAFRLLAPSNSLSEIALYLAIPTSLIVALVFLSKGLTAVAPSFMAVITGAEAKLPARPKLQAVSARHPGVVARSVFVEE